MAQEIWKPLKGFEGRYEVSNYGRFRVRKAKVRWGGVSQLEIPYIKKTENKVQVGVMPNFEAKLNVQKTISRVVAEHFIPNPENKPRVFHLDGNKYNNRADNLIWCTESEGTIMRARARGGENYKTMKERAEERKKKKNKVRVKYGSRTGTASKPVIQMNKEGNVIRTFPSVKEASHALGVSRQTIITRCQTQSKRNKDGLVYCYAKDYEEQVKK